MEEIVKGMFRDVIENNEYNESIIDQYFSDQYIQLVDNSSLDIRHFKQHMQKLKELTHSVTIEILNLAINQDTIFTKHLVQSTLQDGTTTAHKVFAEFKIFNGKIIACDEATLLVSGAAAGKNLGSIL